MTAPDYTALCARLLEAAEELGDEDFALAAAAIRELEARARESAMQELAALGQAQDAYEAQLAAEAKLAEVEKERDALQHAADEGKRLWAASEATVATLTAQVEAMRGALEKIATLAPTEKPPEPYDAYGWQVADTGERHAQMVRDHDMWLVADFARAALTTENQING